MKFFNWGKLFFPTKALKFFPPPFIIRDPILQGIRHAIKQNYEVAVIIFHIQNLHTLKQQLGKQRFQAFQKQLKFVFKQGVNKEISKEHLISLNNYYQDGIALFIKMKYRAECISMMETNIARILHLIDVRLEKEHGVDNPIFDTGYMFLERDVDSIQEAVYTAYHQALTMAQKRTESSFNQMVSEVSEIVDKKNIRLLAQPIIDVHTNQIYACEMLTRGPKGTILESPLQLFSVARQTEFLYDLEIIVLEKTLEQIHRTKWKQDIFINFTPLTIGNYRFVEDLKRKLNEYTDISPRQITIEITERDSTEGLEYFISNLHVLRKLGFRIAVDDTGAGYASLHSISEIMPDIIKIDRSVIHDIDKSTVKESMLKGLLFIAKEVGSMVVAEGIESEAEAFVLSKNKVDLAQGYYYAKPNNLSYHLQT